MIRSIALLLPCLVALLAASRAAADFDSALRAYNELYDYHRAYDEFVVEARKGHAAAQFYLGEICEGGVGRPVDYAAAYHWYRTAALQGYGPAQLRLASLYRDGRGTKRNLALAFQWQRKAAEHGVVVAQYRLGHHYAEGIGTRRDPVLAYMWWTVAAWRGDPDAMPARERLATGMPASQVAEGEWLARQWEENHQTPQAE